MTLITKLSGWGFPDNLWSYKRTPFVIKTLKELIVEVSKEHLTLFFVSKMDLTLFFVSKRENK